MAGVWRECGGSGYDCDVSGCGRSEAGVWRECGGSVAGVRWE